MRTMQVAADHTLHSPAGTLYYVLVQLYSQLGQRIAHIQGGTRPPYGGGRDAGPPIQGAGHRLRLDPRIQLLYHV